jgi:hypothetical protein
MTLMRPSRPRQLARAAAGSRHTWWLIVAGSTSGKDRYWPCWRKSVRYRMLQGGTVLSAPILCIVGMVKIGCLYFYTPSSRRSLITVLVSASGPIITFAHTTSPSSARVTICPVFNPGSVNIYSDLGSMRFESSPRSITFDLGSTSQSPTKEETVAGKVTISGVYRDSVSIERTRFDVYCLILLTSRTRIG